MSQKFKMATKTKFAYVTIKTLVYLRTFGQFANFKIQIFLYILEILQKHNKKKIFYKKDGL
jgi:hypothetical protein